VIAHRLSTIAHADIIVVMEAGQIVERGTHDDLMRARGLYHEMVTRQREAMAAGDGEMWAGTGKAVADLKHVGLPLDGSV
jgi:ABC-type dipeptide/oligopeptide/nickel transport system ATPase component